MKQQTPVSHIHPHIQSISQKTIIVNTLYVPAKYYLITEGHSNDSLYILMLRSKYFQLRETTRCISDRATFLLFNLKRIVRKFHINKF